MVLAPLAITLLEIFRQQEILSIKVASLNLKEVRDAYKTT